jgi:hypothetical protein
MGFKANERVVKCSWVKCSEVPSNRVSNIIGRYIGNVKFAASWLFRFSHSFIFFWLHFLSFYIWLYVLYAAV